MLSVLYIKGIYNLSEKYHSLIITLKDMSECND